MTVPCEEVVSRKNYLPYSMGYLTDWMVQKAEEELGETEEVKARTIPELRKLVEAEPKLECPTDDAYMLQYLRARKFNVNQAFACLQNYYRLKYNNGDIYDTFQINVFLKLVSEKVITCMPYRDQDGCVIFIFRAEDWDPDYILMSELASCLACGILFCIEDVATQVCGIQVIMNFRGATFKQLRSATPRYLKIFSKGLRNSMPVRFKGIHMYNEASIFTHFWSIFRLFLSDKLKKRVHFHGANQKHLHENIPKAILTEEHYGGNINQFNVEDWYSNEIVTNFQDRAKELISFGYRRD